MRRRWPAIVILGLAAAASPVHTPAAQRNQSSTFRSGIEYVPVDLRVLDADGEAVRGLTKDDFQVFENGVAQDIEIFSAIDLPRMPAIPPREERRLPAIAPDAASNVRDPAEGIAYLLVIDDHMIAKHHTTEVRRLVREFIQAHLSPGDVAALMTTGKSHAFQDFTKDKSRLTAAADKLFGDSDGSPTVQNMLSIEYRASTSTVGGNNPIVSPAAPQDKLIGPVRATQEFLAHAVAAMSGMGPRNKAILFISEGSPESVTDVEGVTFFDASIGADVPLLGTVPIYPIDPRGLTALADESIAVAAAPPATALQGEVDASRRRMYRLADDTGGFVVANNNVDRAFDRIARLSGTYYALGYYPKNSRRDGKYRRIEVKVNRPAVTVVSRRGYIAPRDRDTKPSTPGPAGAPAAVRDALNATFPITGLSMSITAAAFRGSGGTPSIAVVGEASGMDGAELDVATIAIDGHGTTKAAEAKKLRWDGAAQVAERVRQNGFRWLSRLSLKPGQYEIRVAGAGGARKRGSVWVDIDVPDFSSGDLAMSGVLIASAAQFRTPTYRPDPMLETALPGPPTASRAFAPGDELTAFAEIYDNALRSRQNVELTIVVTTVEGGTIVEHSEIHEAAELQKSRGGLRFRTSITLPAVAAGDYILAVAARRPGAAAPAVARTVPFQITP